MEGADKNRFVPILLQYF